VGCWLAFVACGARSGLEAADLPQDEARAGSTSTPKPIPTPTPTPVPTPTPTPTPIPTPTLAPPEFGCLRTGWCKATKKTYSGDLGGLEGADKLCQAEYPGSHFYRHTCDFQRAGDAFGFAELEQGPCWSCNGWSANNSGPYQPELMLCPTGYATVGGLIPYGACADPTGVGHCWRICEAGDKPLVCCSPPSP
jgi:hypothetical protein